MSPETQQLIDQAKRGVWNPQIASGLAQALARGEINDQTLVEANLQGNRRAHIRDKSREYQLGPINPIAGMRGLYAGATDPVKDARFMPDQLPRADLQPQREPVDPVTLQPQLPPVALTMQPQPPEQVAPVTMQDWTLPGESSDTSAGVSGFAGQPASTPVNYYDLESRGDILPDFDTPSPAGVSGFAGQPAPEILPPIAPGGITGNAPEYGGPGLGPGVGVGNGMDTREVNAVGVDPPPDASVGVSGMINQPDVLPFNYYDQPETEVVDPITIANAGMANREANAVGVTPPPEVVVPGGITGDASEYGGPGLGLDGVTDPPVDAVRMSPETQQLIDQAKRGVWNPQIVSGLAHAVARGEIVDIYTALENLQPQRLDHIRDQSLQISLMEEAGYVDTPVVDGSPIIDYYDDSTAVEPEPDRTIIDYYDDSTAVDGSGVSGMGQGQDEVYDTGVSGMGQGQPEVLPDEIIPDEVLEGPVVVGTDPIGNAAAGGGPPPESEGDVFDYAPPENTLMPQLQGVYQTLLDTLTGKSQIPGMEDIMGGLAESQREEAALNEQLLALRGVSSSSGIGLADDERERLGTRQRGETAQRAMDVQGQYMQNALMPLNQIFAQGSLGRQQSLNEFLSFLDRQFNRDDQQTAEEAQAIALMLNAMGLQTISPQMPSFTAAQGQPGFNESFMNLVSTLGPSAIERWG